jgi:hypothetical protein
MHTNYRPSLAWTGAVLLSITPLVAAQTARVPHRPLAPNVVVPQSRSFVAGRDPAVQITDVTVGGGVGGRIGTMERPGGHESRQEMSFPLESGSSPSTIVA